MPRSLSAARRALSGWHPSGVEPTSAGRQALYRDLLLPRDLDQRALADCGVGSTKIAIIGAGFAGAMAAWYLEQAGVPVTLFEAKNRLGGRVLSDYSFVSGKVVEAGAELIGANHPLWFELASNFGLSLTELTTGDEYEQLGLTVRLRLGDHDLSDDEKAVVDRDLGRVLDLIGRDAVDVDPVQPWTSPGASRFDALSVSQALDTHFGPVSSLARSLLDFVIENDNCAPVHQQSYLGLLALVSAGRMGDDAEGMRGYWDFTETHRCDGGNQQLADQLCGGLSDVRLASPVDAITIADGSVGIDWSGTSGGSGAFDFVILTAPPTSWPTVEATSWDPRRFTMQQGPAVKYLSGYDREFWKDAALAPTALWDELGSVWEGTDRQQDRPGGFDLSVFSGGRHVLNKTDYPTRLAELYPGGVATNSQFLNWPQVPYIKTGYSVPAPGQVTTVGKLLSEPVGGRLFLAGEQTCMGFFGYMEGALQSGARAAREVIHRLCPATVPSMIA